MDDKRIDKTKVDEEVIREQGIWDEGEELSAKDDPDLSKGIWDEGHGVEDISDKDEDLSESVDLDVEIGD